MITRRTEASNLLRSRNRCSNFLRWAAILLLSVPICAAQAPTTGPSVNIPAALRVNGPIVAEVFAKGSQVYTLKRDKSGKLVWNLKAPDATFEIAPGLKGKHYKGPTWECTTDGSSVVGRKIAEVPSTEPGAIPWFLLFAVSHKGAGVFSTVTYIQRIGTSGGKAPIATDAKPSSEVRVPYTAEYVFYGPGATTQPSNP